MMRSRIALLALCLAGTGALPAPASAEPVYAGFTCGYAGVTASVVTGQSTYSGVVFNYFYAGDSSSGPAVAVAITCSIVVNGVRVASATSATAGPVGLLPPSPVSYVAGPADQVTVCTDVSAQFADGTVFVFVPRTGRCKEVTEAEAGEGAGAQAEPWEREAAAGR